jgi:serine/threonine protein kinase
LSRVDKYQIGQKIGAGAFGNVYVGKHIESGKQVAVKIESQMSSEAEILKQLNGGLGVPRVYWNGRDKNCHAMVIDLFGDSLLDVFHKCQQQFSSKTMMMLAIQMIDRLQFVHSSGYLHRDIKPEHFMLKQDTDCKEVYILDFGLAKKYMDKGEHIAAKCTEEPTRSPGKVCSFSGTASYVSNNVHRGVEPSRRDDMISVAYTLAYFACGGRLPWQKKQYKQIQKCQEAWELIDASKESMSAQDHFPGSPDAFCAYLEHCKGLGFEESPDYQYCRSLFTEAMKSAGLEYDCVFDWVEQAKVNKVEKAVEKDVRVKMEVAGPPAPPQQKLLEEMQAETSSSEEDEMEERHACSGCSKQCPKSAFGQASWRARRKQKILCQSCICLHRHAGPVCAV